MKLFIMFSFLVIAVFNLNAQWVEQNSGTTETLLSVFFINADTGWACGDNGNILFTSDGGQSWVNQPSGLSSGSLNDIKFRNENSGICVGNGGYLTTGNGGQTWSFYAVSDTNIRSVHLSNDTTLWLGGNNKYLLRRFASSSKKISLENPIFNWEVLDITSTDNIVFVLVHFNNTSFRLYKSTDNFETWGYTYLSSNTLHNKADLFFLNDNLGLVGGAYRYSSIVIPQLDKVTSSGDSTTMIFRADILGNFYGSISSLYFNDENTGYMSTTLNPTVYKTTNGGLNWDATEGVQSRITKIYFIDGNTGYAVGEEGKIYKTTNGGGVTSIEDEENIVTQFSLNQNYPNPFNPSTKISFTIPETNFVNLKIYNSLGEEIAVLLNEELNAGRHEINFNASGLASGIYFYKITAGNFSETRKMILLQ